MRKTVSKEYEEEDLDLESLLEGSCSQLEDSVMDLDSILKPLSDSQQALEADLDLRDEEIRNQIATQEERKVRSEQEQVMLRHKKIPTLIKRSPPGLSVFQSEQLLSFSFSDLSLERDFGWSGRKRLEQSGLSSSFVESLVGGNNKLLMVRYLAPETGQNNMVASKEDYQSMVDYVFYLCSVCEDQLTYSVLSKCLFDLLKSCGYPWHVSSTHLLVVLLNLGARQQLLASEHFYQVNLKTSAPAVPRFYQARVDKKVQGTQVDKAIGQKSRMMMLKNTVQLIGILLRMPDRNQLSLDPISMLSMAYLAVTCGQDQAVVDNPTILHPLSMLVGSLVSMLSSSSNSEQLIQDLTELLSAGFLPGSPGMCISSTATWSYTTLPSHMATAGHNHPHNMLAICLLLPPHSSIRHLMCYLYTQLVLGVTSVDLPGMVTMTDLVNMLNTHKMLWRTMAKDQHYSMLAVLGFMDLMVEGDTEELKFETEQFQSLKELIGILEQYLSRVNMNDPLNLDPVTVGEKAGEMSSRWKLAVDRAKFIHSMRVQTGQVMAVEIQEEL